MGICKQNFHSLLPEVPPNSLFVFLNERGSPTTTTWGGGILGGVGGRRKSRLAMLTINKISFDEADYINALPHRLAMLTINKISFVFDEADYINALSHRLASSPSTRSPLKRRTTSMPFQREEVSSILALCQPGQHHVVARRQPLHLQ